MVLACPQCGKPVAADSRQGAEGLRALSCPACQHRFDGRAQYAHTLSAQASSGATQRRPGPVIPAGAAGANPDSTIPSPRRHSSRSAVPIEERAKRLPQKVGPYEILEEVSRGGMGIVYKARDPVLRRVVAIKVLLAGEGATDEDVKRFQREAQASARLQHAHIVTIHSIGHHDDKPYFVMDFIEGKTAKQLLEAGPLSPRLALAITEGSAEALYHAARQGVIHRDMKPANIIVEKSGHAHIMDFGLAKRVDEDLQITQSGTTMGTPSYMSPEQAEGNLAQVDGQSDIYSLGAVLYEMLTGQPPFDGQTTMQILRKVLDEDPVPPRKLNPRVHVDIETICLKCLEKEKPRRYMNGRELADDIRRFNAGEPIAAAPLGWTASWGRKARKHLHLTLSLLAVACFGLAALGWTLYTSNRDRRAQELARRQTFTTELSRGRQRHSEAEEQVQGLGRAPASEFEERAAQARKKLQAAQGDFHRAQLAFPQAPEAQAGLDETFKCLNRLEVEKFVFKARQFLSPPALGSDPAPPNYPGAEAFAQEALLRDPENAEAKAIHKKAIGIRAVLIQTVGESAEVFARLVGDAQGKPLPGALDAGGPGESLGFTPTKDRELGVGLYILTFQRPGYSPQEATLLVTREAEPEVTLTLNTTERNMVLVPAGHVTIPGRDTEKIPAFLIDRFEYPNQAGKLPALGIQSLLEARDLCLREKKLPCTPLQWRRACIGERERKFPYGEGYVAGACATGFDSAGFKQPFPSGWFPRCRTPEGIFDMSGNVSEWTLGDESSEIVWGGDWTDSIRTPELYISCGSRQLPVDTNIARSGVRCCKPAK